jgi:hypothetical protein
VTRIPDTMMKRIDSWAAQYPGLMRSAAVRILIDAGLQSAQKKSRVYDPKSFQAFARDASRSPDRTTLRKDIAARVLAEKDPMPPAPPSPDGVYSAREKRGKLSKEAIRAAVERAEARARPKK